MESRYRTESDETVVVYASGDKNGERHYWLKWNATGNIATLPVVELKRLVATGKWEPIE